VGCELYGAAGSSGQKNGVGANCIGKGGKGEVLRRNQGSAKWQRVRGNGAQAATEDWDHGSGFVVSD